MIQVHDLRKSFGSYSLHIPALDVPEGETLGLVGNNGAGKTTFLRLLLDLLEPDAGTITVGGHPVAESDAWKAFTGSYLDASFLLDFLTADEFFAFVGGLYGMNRDDVQEALLPYRTFLPPDVLGSKTKYLRDLSTGNAKKVGIVAAVFLRPRLLVLDEPFANLDPGSQIHLKLILTQLNTTYGTTVLISSHDLSHVTETCRRITLLDDGRLVRDTATSDDTQEELELYFATRMS